MISVQGIYQDGQVFLLEKIPLVKRAKVIITVLEESQISSSDQSVENTTIGWLGALADTGQITDDIVKPIEDMIADWEVLAK